MAPGPELRGGQPSPHLLRTLGLLIRKGEGWRPHPTPRGGTCPEVSHLVSHRLEKALARFTQLKSKLVSQQKGRERGLGVSVITETGSKLNRGRTLTLGGLWLNPRGGPWGG